MGKRGFLIYLIFIFLPMSSVSSNDELDEKWIKPHAWRDHVPPSTDADKSDETVKNEDSNLKCNNDDNCLRYYTKLFRFLFDKHRIEFDKISGKYQRKIYMHLTEDQFERLKTIQDPIDMDSFISEILKQSNFGMLPLINKYISSYTTYWSDWVDLSTTSPIWRKFKIFFEIIFLVFIYWFCRKFKLKAVVIFGLVIGFFLYEYLDAECNRKKFNEISLNNDKNNPCVQKKWWSTFVPTILVGEKFSDAMCKNYLEQAGKEPECSRVEIFNELINLIVYQQIYNFVGKMIEMLLVIQSEYGFIIVIPVVVFMYAYIGIILKHMIDLIVSLFSLFLKNEEQSEKIVPKEAINERNHINNSANYLGLLQAMHNLGMISQPRTISEPHVSVSQRKESLALTSGVESVKQSNNLHYINEEKESETVSEIEDVDDVGIKVSKTKLISKKYNRFETEQCNEMFELVTTEIKEIENYDTNSKNIDGDGKILTSSNEDVNDFNNRNDYVIKEPECD